MGRGVCQGSKRKVQRSRLVGLCRIAHVHPEATLNSVFITDHPAFACVETTVPSISEPHAGESRPHLPRAMPPARLAGATPAVIQAWFCPTVLCRHLPTTSQDTCEPKRSVGRAPCLVLGQRSCRTKQDLDPQAEIALNGIPITFTILYCFPISFKFVCLYTGHTVDCVS